MPKWSLLLVTTLFAVGAVNAAQPPSSLIGAGEIPTPYLPSTPVAVEEMLRLADVRAADVVVDLGSGDGRIPITAATAFGARGFGVDIDAKLVEEANENARKAGVEKQVRFFQRDVFETDIREATVVTLYLLSGLVNRLKPKLMKELRPGTRIVAHEYGFSDWKPDRHVNVSKNYYLYVVPAAVAGKWELTLTLPSETREYVLELTQRFQEVRGGARVAGGYLPAFDPRLSGDRIAFVLVDDNTSYRFEGRAGTNEIAGVVRWGMGPRQQEGKWRAVRVSVGAEG